MKKYIIAIAVSLASLQGVNAQEVRQGFETVPLDSGEVVNGKNGEKSFDILGAVPNYVLKMPMQYDTSWGGYWSGGWAISKKLMVLQVHPISQNTCIALNRGMVPNPLCKANKLARPSPLA